MQTSLPGRKSLRSLHDTFTAFVVGDVTSVPEHDPAPYRAHCRAVLVWIAVVIGVTWVVLDPLLFHGTLSSVQQSFAITNYVVFDPNNPSYMLEDPLLQQVAYPSTELAGSGSSIPQCPCVYASGTFNEPAVIMVVEEFGNQDDDSDSICTNKTLEQLLPSYVTTNSIDPAMSALLRKAVRHFCLLVVHNPVTSMLSQPSHVMLSSKQWAAMRYLAITEHLRTLYLMTVNHYLDAAAALDTPFIQMQVQGGAIYMMTSTLVDVRTRLLCSIPGVNATQLTINNQEVTCVSRIARRLNMTLITRGQLVNGSKWQTSDQSIGYELYRIWCAPRSCVVTQQKSLYKRTIEFLGLLGGLFAIWRFLVVTCLWNGCCRSTLVCGHALSVNHIFNSLKTWYRGMLASKQPLQSQSSIASADAAARTSSSSVAETPRADDRQLVPQASASPKSSVTGSV